MAKVPTAVEAGFGQVQTSPDTTPFQSEQVVQGAFGGEQAKSLQIAGQGISKLADFANQVTIVNDQNAVSIAMQKARDASNSKLTDSLYSKTYTSLFANGKGIQDAHKSSMKILEDVNRSTRAMLNGPRQQAMFTQAWTKFQATESRRASTHISSQFRTYTGEVEKQENTTTESEIAVFAGNAASADWRNTDKFEAQANLAVDLHEETGLNPTDAEKLRISIPKYMAASAVRGWHSTQENLLQASQQLASGKLPDPLAQKYWDKLDAKQKKAVRNDLISQGDQLIRSQNNQRKIADDAKQQNADKAVSDFWTMDKPTQEGDRQTIYETQIKGNAFIPIAQQNAARESLYGGEVTTDSEPGLLELEAAIRDGDINSMTEANAFRYGNKAVATTNTMRTRIFPLVEASKDKVFRDAMSIGLAQLGISNTAAETNVVLKQRAASYKAQFLQWKNSPEGKTGDPLAASQEIADKIKQDIKVDPQTMTMLKSIKARYDLAVTQGNTVQAAASLSSMQGLMGMLGLTLEDIK